MLGRLKPGVSLAQAQAEMNALAQRVAKERPATHTGWSTHLRPLALQVAGKTRPVLFMLLGAVAFVLPASPARMWASLLLGRSTARRREIAIRAAIGAGRGRVIRQLLTESLLLALFGGLAGWALGYVGLRVLLALSPPNIARLREAAFDGSGLCILVIGQPGDRGVLFGLFPAWHASKVNLTDALNAAGRSHSAGGRSQSYRGLVTAEVAVAVMLLVGAGLMLQSFQHLLAVDAGFAKAGVGAFDLTFRGARYATGESRIGFIQQMRERLGALPGVRGVAAISQLPLGGSEHVGYFLVEGLAEPAPGHEPLAEQRLVTLGYFETMSISLMQGRDFTPSDGPGKPPVAIVNETLAHQFFPGGDAVGRRIKLKESGETGDWLTIVGVARDVRGAGLEVQPRPGIYRPHSQDPGYWDEMTVVARGAGAGLPSGSEWHVAPVKSRPLIPRCPPPTFAPWRAWSRTRWPVPDSALSCWGCSRWLRWF